MYRLPFGSVGSTAFASHRPNMNQNCGVLPRTMALLAKETPHHAYRARFLAFDIRHSYLNTILTVDAEVKS